MARCLGLTPHQGIVCSSRRAARFGCNPTLSLAPYPVWLVVSLDRTPPAHRKSHRTRYESYINVEARSRSLATDGVMSVAHTTPRHRVFVETCCMITMQPHPESGAIPLWHVVSLDRTPPAHRKSHRTCYEGNINVEFHPWSLPTGGVMSGAHTTPKHRVFVETSDELWKKNTLNSSELVVGAIATARRVV